MARFAAGGALLAAVVVLAVLLLTSGSSYTLNLTFQDSGGLVSGNLVMIGPAQVGSVNSIGLTQNGLAQVQISLNSTASPVHQGTVARIFENSLSGSANRYVVLEPGPTSAAEIPSGGTLGLDQTHSFVNLDQVFDAFNPLTRLGLRNFIQGQAASIQGRALEAHQTLLYFAPALSSTSNVTQELVRDEPAFDGLLVQGAKAMSLLSSRSQELTQLIANGDVATGAIARQAQNLELALQRFPPALNGSTQSFKGLNTTLDALDPLVAATKQAIGPGGKPFLTFATDLNQLTGVSIPTLNQLNALISNPAGTGDLTTLLRQTPALEQTAVHAFPRLITEMNRSQAQLDTFREYTPDLVAAFSDLGQVGGYYDANGHYARTQPGFFAFNKDASNQLQVRNPSQRYSGLSRAIGRCPGSAMQPTADGSAPWNVPGCSLSAVPPGP